MSFKEDVKAALGPGYLHQGLGALRAIDKTHIDAERPARLLGSADLDQALVAQFPNAARWDYLIGQSHGKNSRVHWIEIHPASGRNSIKEVENKLSWLLEWLRGKALARYSRQIVWVASGKSAFNARDPHLKRLAIKGCYFAGGYLRI